MSPVLLFLPSENYQYTVLESLPVRSVVAKIKAADADIGSNAEMDYRIMDSDMSDVFNITTDEDTQDGVITLLKVTTAWVVLYMMFHWCGTSEEPQENAGAP